MNTILLGLLLNPVLGMQSATEFTKVGQHEKAIQVLQNFKSKSGKYCYLMAVNHCALNHAKEAALWAERAEDSFDTLPERYRCLARLIKEDAAQWTEGDLNDIARDMKHAESKLNNGDMGKKTRQVQEDIVKKLNKLIKEKEDAELAAQQAAIKKALENSLREVLPNQGAKPLQDSLPAKNGGPGNVDPKKIKDLTENWGNLPEKERATALLELTRDMPPRYREAIENYFRKLTETTKKEK